MDFKIHLNRLGVTLTGTAVGFAVFEALKTAATMPQIAEGATPVELFVDIDGPRNIGRIEF